jgi:hypothetical protein
MSHFIVSLPETTRLGSEHPASEPHSITHCTEQNQDGAEHGNVRKASCPDQPGIILKRVKSVGLALSRRNGKDVTKGITGVSEASIETCEEWIKVEKRKRLLVLHGRPGTT